MKRVYLVNYSKCAYNSCGRPCITFCPVTITNKKKAGRIKRKKIRPAIDFKKSTNEIIINSEICIKCGICINKCPNNAIFLKNFVEEDESEQKIHQYGLGNSHSHKGFRLYNLPTLVPGRVTGICGPNGIGKSTIMNILGTNIKPNFGIINGSVLNSKQNTWDKIAVNIKDNDIRNHFLEVAANNRRISYKKQILNVLFKEYSGLTVSEILDKNPSVDEDFKNLVFKALDIDKIKTRRLEHCSGGELQRFAISIVILSDVDVYLIDEPCTYLDVKKRIKLAEVLRIRAAGFPNLLQKKRAVLVAEHDLTILDYMSDVIHLFYGEPHEFGNISRVLPVRRGINSYLHGYLQNENLEFRQNQLYFKKTISGRTWSNAQKFAEWGMITKDLGAFHLKINPGTIYQNEILGIVGENGLGKTTFFKIFVGMLKPDSGELNLMERFAISYKPQYITGDYKGTVEDLISEYSKKYIHTEDLLRKLYGPLGVEKLFSSKVSELSGGQLQRTFIAACLTKDSDLYLIDEPSAYLDVEERLKIGEIIRAHTNRSNSTCICVEHDIQIVDSIADRLLIFLGDPGKNGYTQGPMKKRDGMNEFLKSLDITFRRDEETGRARINKKGSHLDQKQRANGEYYYVKLKERSDFLN
ncbi:MAG: ribosome biogenesis/translation initiation ATPase RLI [Promethearchaeota archaeon]